MPEARSLCRPRRPQARLAITALVCVTALICAAAPAAAAPPEAVYTVGNYPVEARAGDAVTAKATAIADGQQAALRALLKRVVPVTAYGRLRDLPTLSAADMVAGVSVRKERNSATDYIATLDFAFQPEAVRDALRQAGIPYVDRQAAPIMVIPLWRSGPQAALESGKGPWFEAWSGLDLTNTLTPVKLEGLKPGLTVETLRPVLDGKAATAQVLGGEYRTDRIVLAFAEPDAKGERLTVTLAGRDAVGAFALKRAYRITGGDRAYAADLAAVVGLGILEGRWKAVRSAAGGPESAGPTAGAIPLVVEFTSLAEWNDLRGRILDADGAYDIAVGAVSPRSAEMTIRHPGGPRALSAALARAGLGLTDAGGTWVVRAIVQ